MSAALRNARFITPRAEYWGELNGEQVGYLTVATSDTPPPSVAGRPDSFIIPFIDSITEIRTKRFITPILNRPELERLILGGECDDDELPTSGHFYAASIRVPQYDTAGHAVPVSPSDYEYDAYLRLGDSTRDEFDIAEIAIRGELLNSKKVVAPLLGSLLRPAIEDLVGRPRISVYTDFPSELGNVTMQSFSFKPAGGYGYEGYRSQVLECLEALGPDHLNDN